MNISSIGGSTNAYGLAAMQAMEGSKARRAETGGAAAGKSDQAGSAGQGQPGGTTGNTGDTATVRLAALQTAASDMGNDATASQNPRLAQAYGAGGPRAGAYLSVMA